MNKHIKIHMSTNFYDFRLHWKILGAILENHENWKNDINKKIHKILTIYATDSNKKPICSSGAVLQLLFRRIFCKCDIEKVISKIRNLGGIGPPKRGVKSIFESASRLDIKQHVKLRISTKWDASTQKCRMWSKMGDFSTHYVHQARSRHLY